MPFDAPNEKVDPLEAIDYFKGRLDLPDDVAKALYAESRAKAFWVSGITDVDILTDVHDSLNRALEKGTTYEDWLGEIGDTLEDAWGGDVANPGWRCECLPGNIPITSAVIRTAHRRWFEGTLIEIITASGRKFSATANHPMLTRRGWVGAGQLNELDDLVCYNRQEDLGSAGNHDVADPPPSISELFSACSDVGSVERIRATLDDFHGDGTDGYVDVARPARDLRVGRFSPLLEPVGQDVFTEAALATPRFCGHCGHLLMITQRCGFCDASSVDPRVPENAGDGVVARAKFFSERVAAFPRGVAPNNLVGGEIPSHVGRLPATSVEEQPCLTGTSGDPRAPHPIMHVAGCSPEHSGNVTGCNAGAVQFHSPILQRSIGPESENLAGLLEVSVDSSLNKDAVDVHGRNAMQSGNLAAAQPADIGFDRVASLHVVEFRGHVYNLSTPYGYFIANGLVTGNTIFRNNVQKAYNAGRWKQHEEVAEEFPYAILDVVRDPRTSEICEALDDQLKGMALPVNDPFWATRIPPLHHGCRSTVIFLDEAQAEEVGIAKRAPKVEAAEGFGAAPDEDDWRPDPDDYPTDFQAAVKDILDESEQELSRVVALFNENHDPATGQFSSGGGSGRTAKVTEPNRSTGSAQEKPSVKKVYWRVQWDDLPEVFR